MKSPTQNRAPALGYGLVVLILMAVGVVWGAVDWSLAELRVAMGDLVEGSGSAAATILEMRLVRVASAAIVGAGLALSGSVLQRLLRNPLADPFVLGISAGGTAAAALATVVGLPFLFFGIPVRMLAAFVGCLATLSLILAAKRFLGHLQDEYAIPVLGLVLNAFFGAFLMLFVALAEQSRVSEVYRWMVGSLQLIGLQELGALAFVAVVVFAVILKYAGPINTLSFGDDFSRSIGFPAESLRRRALFLVALLVAAIVAVSGTVGFVGLIVPHVARRFHRHSVRTEWLASAALGAVVLLVGDVLSRTLAAPTELPVGMFTALVGAPALAFLLLKRAKKHA